MKKETLYNIVLKATKKINPKRNKYICNNCIAWYIQEELKKTNIKCDYHNGSDCYNVLFFLQDHGIIKILSGIPNRSYGVDCRNLKIKILKPGNKI